MKKTIFIIGLILAAACAVTCWIFLPETVAVQFKLDGSVSSTMPKLGAVLGPLAISVVGSVIGLKAEDGGKKTGIFITAVGILVMIIMLVLN